MGFHLPLIGFGLLDPCSEKNTEFTESTSSVDFQNAEVKSPHACFSTHMLQNQDHCCYGIVILFRLIGPWFLMLSNGAILIENFNVEKRNELLNKSTLGRTLGRIQNTVTCGVKPRKKKTASILHILYTLISTCFKYSMTQTQCQRRRANQ